MDLYEYLYGAYSAAARIKLGQEGWTMFHTHIEHWHDQEIIIYHFKRLLK